MLKCGKHMSRAKVIYILFILVFLGLVLEPSGLFYDKYDKEAIAGQSYLPKADLIKGSGPEVYVLENGVRHWIPNPKTFEYLRYKWTNVKTISGNLLNSYPLGKKMSKYSAYPDGSLVKGGDPQVYLIELDKKRWIPNPEVFEKSDFGWKYIIEISDRKLKRIKEDKALALYEPNRYPTTVILSGPEKNATLETVEVTFKYSGSNPLGSNKDLSFETYLVGYDKRWRNQGSRYIKTYKLSKESRVYTFYVRAKNKQGYLDPTPASLTFQVGISPYFQKVEIKRVRARQRDFQKDYLVLRSKSKELIDISGWTLETSLDYLTIPQAIEKLRHPFSAEEETDIKINYRDEVIISAGWSPRGINFRTNKCTGYLDQLSQFYPRLDEKCPRLEESEYRHLRRPCRDFIEGLSRCEIPNYSYDEEVNSDSQCVEFLNEKFNYQECYDDHCQEIDFFEDEWRAFFKRSIDVFDNGGDTIILRDQSGLVVDEYSY